MDLSIVRSDRPSEGSSRKELLITSVPVHQTIWAKVITRVKYGVFHHLSLEKPLYKNWLVSFSVMLLAARLKRSESVVTVQSISWIIRLLGFGSWWHRLKRKCSKLRSACNLPLSIWWKKTLLTSHVKKTSRHEIQTFSYQIYIKRLRFHHACTPYGK